MEIKILEAKPNDWEIIQNLMDPLFTSEIDNDEDLDMEWVHSKEGFKYCKEIAKGIGGLCYIAYADNIPVGFIALHEKDFGYRKSKYIEVGSLGVNPEYRSHGIGKLLIEEAGKWAKKKNASKLYVSVYSKNSKGLNFYEKNDFYQIGVEMDKKL
ncbi:MAG TPA: GNAT family N-acetyltransferase [Patescibacteria group bacterium]|nr:GNAT family N-acetyltransferase [Patescibacteria group bacterium]